MEFRKDQSLDELAKSGNVAQFVSFAPLQKNDPEQTFSRVWQYPPNHNFRSPAEAIHELLKTSPDRSINIRCFTPNSPRSREFLYGLTDPNTALGHLQRLTAEGLYVIVNETIDISDGGVSGVIEGGVIEFSPDDTPRCVEKAGTVTFALDDGRSVLRTVYGFELELPELKGNRVEFSIHPRARGYKRTHTVLWEYEQVSTLIQNPNLSWPNRFSRVIGDKAFGLLVADLIGMPVPHSIVIGRRVRPFMFGQTTGSNETWLRTCPAEQDPGRYTTVNSWIDPFELLAAEDPGNSAIASIISQAAVPARYSGAAITKKDGKLHIEGTSGAGDSLMLGRVRPSPVPERVLADLRDANKFLCERLGPIRFEWAHDGKRVWILQLHKGRTSSSTSIIVPGEASDWVVFRSDAGLEALRELLSRLPSNVGLKLEGEIGLTSHIADLARKSGRPTRISHENKLSTQLQFELD